MADLKISQFADGGPVQTTDQIATVRGGVNTKVFVGYAAALDAGTSPGDLVQFLDDGFGLAAYPGGDASALTNVPVPDAVDVPYNNSSSGLAAVNVQEAIDELQDEIADFPTDSQAGIQFQNEGANIGASGAIDKVDFVGSGVVASVAGSVMTVNVTGGGGGGGAVDSVNSQTGDVLLDAADIPYDNTSSGLTATDTQDAIDELATAIDDLEAVDVEYDNTTSGLSATQVQDAIDELAALTGGSLVDFKSASYTGITGISTNVPEDDTAPQITEGGELTTVTITPKSTTNILEVTYSVTGQSSNTSQWVAFICQDAISNCLDAAPGGNGDASKTPTISKTFTFVPGTTSTITLRLRAGSVSGSFYPNSNIGGSRLYGGKCSCTITVREYLP